MILNFGNTSSSYLVTEFLCLGATMIGIATALSSRKPKSIWNRRWFLANTTYNGIYLRRATLALAGFAALILAVTLLSQSQLYIQHLVR